MFSTGLAPLGAQLRRALHKGKAAVVVASALAVASVAAPVQARTSDPAADQISVVALATLPKQAQATYELILAGGPFPYSKDGTTFGNRERLLPAKPRGFYREYTVKTPGSKDRGARRIVCGGKPPVKPEACYYTDDHYASFKRIAP